MLKGLGDDMGLIDWIQRLLVPTMPEIDDEAAYLGSALGRWSRREAAAPRCSTSCTTSRASLYDETIRAWDEIGGSLIMARTVRDSVGQAVAGYEADLTLDQQLAHVEALLDQHGRGPVWVAPGTVWGMSPDGLRQVRTFADRLGVLITIHMNEVAFDSEESVRRYGMRSIPFLASIGFLRDDVLHAHGVWNDDEDIRCWRSTAAPSRTTRVSNMYLGSGVPPIVKMREAGVRLSLATDGAASNNSQDMIEALKLGALLQKVAHKDSTAMTAPEILRMATVGGADALRGRPGVPGAGDAGRLLPLRPAACEVDAAARSDLDAGLHGGEQNVVTTVSAGRVVLEDGKIVTANRRELLERAQDAARAAGAAGGHQVVGTSLTRPYRVARSSSPARCRAGWRGTSPRATRSVFRPWRRGGGRRPEDRVEEGAQVGLRAGVVDDAGPQHEPGRRGWSGSRTPRRRPGPPP